MRLFHFLKKVCTAFILNALILEPLKSHKTHEEGLLESCQEVVSYHPVTSTIHTYITQNIREPFKKMPTSMSSYSGGRRVPVAPCMVNTYQKAPLWKGIQSICHDIHLYCGERNYATSKFLVLNAIWFTSFQRVSRPAKNAQIGGKEKLEQNPQEGGKAIMEMSSKIMPLTSSTLSTQQKPPVMF